MKLKSYSIRCYFYKIAAIFFTFLYLFYVLSFSSWAKESSQVQEESPDVIVIMNESFFDPSTLLDLSVNEDFLPFFHSLEEYTGKESDNVLKGTLHVSDIGGNSTNTEFEFLTGNSMTFLSPSLSPYSNYLNEESEYLPELFKKSGYNTAAIYPYKGSSWNRNLAYSIMDFSESYFQDSFDSPKMVRNYISDQAVYQKAMQICEKSPQPVFVFCSTIQNHSGYQKSYSNFTPSIQSYSSNSLNQYLSLLKESDHALESLIHHVSESDSKTMVVFFGNHQPNDYVIAPIYDFSSSEEARTSPDIRYTVPYLIWANFDLSGYEMPNTSPSLLGNTVLEACGIQTNQFQEFLSEFKTVIPAISSRGYFDKQETFHPFSSSTDEIGTSEEMLYIKRYHDMVTDSNDFSN